LPEFFVGHVTRKIKVHLKEKIDEFVRNFEAPVENKWHDFVK